MMTTKNSLTAYLRATFRWRTRLGVKEIDYDVGFNCGVEFDMEGLAFEVFIFEYELFAPGGRRHEQVKEVYFFGVGHVYFNPFAMSRISARTL